MTLQMVGLAFVLVTTLPAAQETQSLADRARAVLKQCTACHGPKTARADLKVLDHARLLDKERHLVVGGKPDESELLQLVECGSMPPGITPKLSKEDQQVLRDWIADGARPFPPHTGEPYILARIEADVTPMKPKELANVRYISLNHLLDDSDGEENLPIYRAALVQALNLLSTKTQLVTKLDPIDPDQTIFRIHIDDFGWDTRPFVADLENKAKVIDPTAVNLYDLVLLEYPFAAAPVNARQSLVKSYLKPVNLLRPVPYIRGDWFVAMATQAPLYYELLDQPRSLRDLEKQLEVKPPPRRRAGLIESKYLRTNRILERGESDKAVYWRTFDLAPPQTLQGLLQEALADPPEHVGSEAIFSLPNGLPGFFTAGAMKKSPKGPDDVSAKGWRLDAVPRRRLKDKLDLPVEAVHTGLSCVLCHTKGLAPFTDVVYDKAAKDAAKLRERYAPLDTQLNDDNQRFAELPRAPVDNPLRFVAERFARNRGTHGVPPIDAVTLPQHQPAGDRIKVELTILDKDGNPQTKFRRHDKMTINLENKGSQSVSYALVAASITGVRFVFRTGQLGPGKTYAELLNPPEDELLGEEHLTVFAVEGNLPPPVRLIVAGEAEPRRVVHALYKVDDDGTTIRTLLDPAGVAKRTVTFETVAGGTDK